MGTESSCQQSPKHSPTHKQNPRSTSKPHTLARQESRHESDRARPCQRPKLGGITACCSVMSPQPLCRHSTPPQQHCIHVSAHGGLHFAFICLHTERRSREERIRDLGLLSTEKTEGQSYCCL